MIELFDVVLCPRLAFLAPAWERFRSPRRELPKSLKFVQTLPMAGFAIDLLTVPTIWFEELYIYVVLTHARRKIAILTVTGHRRLFGLRNGYAKPFPGTRRQEFSFGIMMRNLDMPLDVASRKWEFGITQRAFARLGKTVTSSGSLGRYVANASTT
jgi:hypothetical protein